MARHFKTVDVRPIVAEGAEPFPKILSAIQTLRGTEGLSVIAPFLPSPLIERLGSEGFESRVERRADGSWVAHFWRDE
jgi:uncharacterized protein (DUF2249 family)